MMKRFQQNIFSTLALLCLLSSTTQAATYYVATTGSDTNTGTADAPFLTIQKGLATAINSDTVLVANGTYTGANNINLFFGGKAITLRSLGGAANCIIDCEGAGRGLLFLAGETVQAVVDGFTIRNGSSAAVGSSAGGGIFIANSSPTIKNCTITGNSAANSAGNASGGGIYVGNGSPVITSCTLSNNTVQAVGGDAAGGGITCQVGGNPLLSNCVITGNTVSASNAVCYGGGVFGAGSGSLTLTDCEIGSNSLIGTPTDVFGGGVYLTDNRSGALTDCQIYDNTAASASHFMLGGGVGIASTATLTRCTLQNNRLTMNAANRSAQGGGLGVIGTGASATLNACTLTGNQCIASNGAPYGGGAVNQGATLTLNRCLLESNVLTGAGSNADGGGIASISGNFELPSATTVLSGCILRNNSSTGALSQGGGVVFHNKHANSRIVNCLFVGNSVTNNGNAITIASAGTPILITNCTFVGNFGGLSTVTGINATLTNCILYHNLYIHSEIGPFSQFTITYCNIEGGFEGTGNIDANPLFINAAAGDYHLKAGSPCLNTGTASAPGLPFTDFDGYARNQGGVPDMGIFEAGGAPAYNLYVALSGNDANAGTPTAPLRTVTKALSLLTDPFAQAQINVQQGNYGTDRPRITRKVRLVNWGNTGQARIGKP